MLNTHSKGPSSARFLTLEGGDGAGKTTLLQKIEAHFRNANTDFLLTREPGGTPVAEQIREILLAPPAPGHVSMTAMTELFLYEASRNDHVEKVIRPALAQGKHVLCDRFTTSSLAYQGVARKLGFETVEKLNTLATNGLEPDAVIWLKIPVEAALERMRTRGGIATRLDAESVQFHKDVFIGFEKAASKKPEQFIVLDATLKPDAVFESLLQHPLWQKLFGNLK